ncbi:MAG TPA: DUF302 domain-containing protein [Gammaproteobacteria bacterium]|nr:DUF302 domain-containing protein [Gammaproteobacteria bacterium]
MRRWLAALLLLLSPTLFAQELYMVRSRLSFPEAMTVLQEAIREQGYRISRVQRVDIGLTTFGYKTDKYRVVFFGTLDELRMISDRYPDLVPYFPTKIAIFAEGDETILLAASFAHLRPFFKEAELQRHFDHWEADIRAILERVRTAEQ